MSILPKLELSQRQSLVISQRIQRALALLQLNNIDLEAFVHDELEQNPLLESEESTTQENKDPENKEGAQLEEDQQEFDSHDYIESENLATDENAPLDTDYDTQWDEAQNTADQAQTHYKTSSGSGDFSASDINLIDQLPEKEKTLKEHMLDQIGATFKKEKERFIASHIVDYMDDAGYMPEPLDTIAKSLNCPVKTVKRILLTMQNFDPIGVMSANLHECLKLQLMEKRLYTKKFGVLIENLELIADYNYQGLCEKCESTVEQLKEMLAVIQTLNPKPGAQFSHEDAETLIPDVYIRRGANNTYYVELNNETLPRLLINDQYLAKVQSGVRKQDEKEFIVSKLSSAYWLINALQQRASSLLKVSTEIVQKQKGFLDKGIEHLKPMRMADISQKVDLHESTVSRVVMNKYISTPRGIFAMKDFFTRAILPENEEDKTFSTETAKYFVKKLIEEEDHDNVLTDDKIVEILIEKGMTVARRTIVKYRKQFNIPSSVIRKKIHAQKDF